MTPRTPEWVKNAIFYQIYPDRFARSSRTKHVPGITFKPWGSPPEEQGYQGGDLRGIVDRLDYLAKLNINAIYLNPIFASASNHRYHTFDYMQVDPLLGGNEALRELLDEAHARDIRIVLDGVFNHASRGFWPFHHILENGGNSPYIDWFTIHGWPLRPYSSSKKRPANYDAWWNLPALPKLNIQNPGVRQYILDVARHWIDFGIDGWRLDVPEEIKDVEFWREFRKTVKDANPDAYICGEIWHLAPDWLEGDQLDALMNYPLGTAALRFFGAGTLRKYRKNAEYKLKPLGTGRFAKRIDKLFSTYHWETSLAQLNLFGSHDTPRALWSLGEDKSALKLCTLFLMTMPGAPCIYYGDEIGLSGADDPHCRGAFPWEQEDEWDHDLLDFFRRATALRQANPCLRTGSFHPLYRRKGIYAFARKLDGREMIVIFNRKKSTQEVTLKLQDIIPDGTAFQAVYGEGKKCTVQDQRLSSLEIPGRDALVLASVK